jgi:imidazolonepropionase-like amidohydrolase
VTTTGVINAVNTTISAISDVRFKENIQDLDVGLDKIMALKPRKFDWKTGKGKDIKGDRGWIAQEFEQVFPDMIDTWRDPAPEGEEPYKAVRADLIPVLVKAIQEQQAMINELKAEVAALKGA